MILLVAAILIAAVFSAGLSSRLGIPVLVAFIGLGILVGSDVLNLIYFDDALLTKRVADVLLVFIIFIGGFQTRRSALRSVAAPALSLATFGVFLTAGLLGLLIRLVARLPWDISLLVASIISSTDAAAVMLVTRSSPVRERVATTLEVESAANDPAAILLTIAFAELAAGKAGSGLAVAASLLWQLAGGVVVGRVLSRAATFLFDRLETESRGYYDVLIVGLVLLTYGAADLVKANGIIAVFFMGYWLGNSEFAGKRGVGNFLEGVSAFGNLALFLMLGLLAFPHHFLAIWKEGLLIAFLTIFVVRPLVVLACTQPFGYAIKERLFIMWGGIKGAVPIVLATYPAVYGLDPDNAIFDIIFFAVLVSCLLQGTTMGVVGRLLGLSVPAGPRSPHSIELHSTRRSEAGMFELVAKPGTRAAGRKVRDLGLPREALITAIVRDRSVIPPKGDTLVAAGDILFVLAPGAQADALSAAIEEPEPPPGNEASSLEGTQVIERR